MVKVIFILVFIQITNNMYRIRERKYSSNVIERLKPGTTKTWEVYLCPTVRKVEGDKLIEKIIKFLNQ